jgi:hypothetical protein
VLHPVWLAGTGWGSDLLPLLQSLQSLLLMCATGLMPLPLPMLGHGGHLLLPPPPLPRCR